MAGFDACVAEIVQAAGGAISQARAKEILSGLEERHARTGDLAKAAAEMSDEARMAAAIEKRNALLNQSKRENLRARVIRNADTINQASTKGLFPGMRQMLGLAVHEKSTGAAEAFGAEMSAINTPIEGGRFSTEAVWKAQEAAYTTELGRELGNAGLLAMVRGGEIERTWGRELWELSRGADGKLGVTGNKLAEQIAKVIHKYQSLAKVDLNREGAWIGDYAGYITRTAHDADKIRRAGFDSWSRDIVSMMGSGAEKTFEGVEDRARMLQGAHEALVSGVHLKDDSGVGVKDPAFTGPGNAAKKLSQSRTFHFADADGWLDYQAKYGTGSLWDQVMGQQSRAARQYALMHKWGTNPLAEMQSHVQWLKEELRSNPDAVAAVRKGENWYEKMFANLDGRANMPVNEQMASALAGLRAIKSMASLGNVVLTHLAVGVTKPLELRYHGMDFFDRHVNTLASFGRGRGMGEARELWDVLRSGAEGMHGHIASKFSLNDSAPGTVSRLSNTFFRASGLTDVLDRQKAGVKRGLSRMYGMRVDSEFGALPAEMQRTLNLYAISPAEWDALRSAPDHLTVDGRVHLTPDAAQRATPENVATITGSGVTLPGAGTVAADRLQEGARQQLGLKLHALYQDIADRAIVTPGIRERALLLGGTRPGTMLGELARFIAQFKTWGFAAARQGIGRELYGGQGVAGAASGVFQLAAGSALLGYTVMALKDLTAGKNPRPVNDAKTWLAAMIQGGGFGILGDFLFGQYSRTGAGFGDTILGTVAGQTTSDILRVYNDMKDHAMGDDPRGSEARDIGPELLRIGQSWTPFINLFYTKMAVQYMLVHQWQEMMSPGYLRRQEQRLKQQSGQTYWLSPSRVHSAAGSGLIASPAALVSGASAPQLVVTH